MDEFTLLNKDLCDCHDPRNCLRTVIERSSNITATKSKNITDPNNLNIAHAGIYQRKAKLDPVKRVKNLVIEFHSAIGKRKLPQGGHWHYAKGFGKIERSEFERKFEGVSGLFRRQVNENGATK